MRERPILFSAPMVRAILDGRKTVTRRVAKLNYAGRVALRGRQWHVDDPNAFLACPYGVPGDRLWVRENFMPAPMEVPPESPRRTRWDIVYAAGGAEERMAPAAYNPMLYNYERWSPSIHMPRWASRITLEVVGVRVERLQEIVQADAIAEGGPPDDQTISAVSREFGYEDWPRSWFAQLWDNINAKRGYGWDANPWVWRIEFRRIPIGEWEG